MTDYRDVQDEHRRPDRQRTYPGTGEGGSNALYWIIGIAALVVIGALFLLGGDPEGTSVATDPAAMTDSATTGALPEDGAEAPAADGAADPAAGGAADPAAPAPAPAQ